MHSNTAQFGGHSRPFDRELCSKVLKEAMLLLLLARKHEQKMLFLENFFEFHEKTGHFVHCQQSSVSMKLVESKACPQNYWNSELVHQICGNQCSVSTKLVEFSVSTKLVDFFSRGYTAASASLCIFIALVLHFTRLKVIQSQCGRQG